MADVPQNVKFWAFLASAILAVAVLVMLIDMSIKASILQESNALRLVIEGSRNDQGREARNMDAAPSNGSSPPNVLAADDAGLEKGDVPAGDPEPDFSQIKRATRPNTRGPRNRNLPETD